MHITLILDVPDNWQPTPEQLNGLSATVRAKLALPAAAAAPAPATPAYSVRKANHAAPLTPIELDQLRDMVAKAGKPGAPYDQPVSTLPIPNGGKE